MQQFRINFINSKKEANN